MANLTNSLRLKVVAWFSSLPSKTPRFRPINITPWNRTSPWRGVWPTAILKWAPAGSRSENSGYPRIDFVRFPEHSSFHPTSNHHGLSGHVPCQGVRRKKHCRIGNVFRPRDLRQGHGGGDFSYGGRFLQLVSGAGDRCPSRTNAIHTSPAILRRM